MTFTTAAGRPYPLLRSASWLFNLPALAALVVSLSCKHSARFKAGFIVEMAVMSVLIVPLFVASGAALTAALLAVTAGLVRLVPVLSGVLREVFAGPQVRTPSSSGAQTLRPQVPKPSVCSTQGLRVLRATHTVHLPPPLYCTR